MSWTEMHNKFWCEKGSYLTISANTIGISADARKLLGNPATVSILVDEEHDLIGLRPTGPWKLTGTLLGQLRCAKVCSKYKHLNGVHLVAKMQDGMLVVEARQ